MRRESTRKVSPIQAQIPEADRQVVVNPTTPSVAVPTPLEYAESTSVCLEWRLSGLKAMYDSTKGDVKSYVDVGHLELLLRLV